MSSGDVIFSAKLDTKQFDKQVSQIEKRKIKSPFAKFRDDFKFFTAGMRASKEQFKAAQKEALGYKKIYEDLARQAEELKSKMNEGVGGDTFKFALTKQYEELSEKVKKAKEDMEEANGYMKHASRGNKFGDFLKNIASKLSHIGDLFKGVGKHAKSSGNSISHGMGMGIKRILGLIGAGSLLYKTFQYVREGMANLVKYDKATANAVNSLKGALSGLKNALASAFSPILQAIEPILTKFIGILTSAANAVAMFFSALTGKKITVVATQVAGGLDGIGSSASGANKSAKELQRTLMGFDKINKLDSDNGSGGGGGGGGSGGGGGFTTVPITEDALDWAEKFKESWEKADFYWLGELLANKINDALEKINWDKINDVLQRLAKSIGTFLNGFIENLDWSLLGQTISNGIKAGLDFSITLLNTINWEAIGKAIVDFIVGIDWVGVFQRAFVQLPSALLNALLGIFKGAFQELATKLSEMMPEELRNIFSGLGSSIMSITPSIDWSGLGKKTIDVVARFTDWVKGGGFSSTIGGMISAFTSWAKAGGFSSTVGSMISQFSSWKKASSFSNVITGLIASFSSALYGGKKSKKKSKKKGSVRASGGIFYGGQWHPIQSYATGGEPNEGQLFYARENGPELVGTLGGHTAVMNNDQIVASVSNGVARAMQGLRISAPPLAMSQKQTQASGQQTQSDVSQVLILLRQLIEVVNGLDLSVELDGEAIKRNTVQRINQHTRSTGQLELIV